MDVRHLGAMALVLVVATIIMSIGGSILLELQEEQCDDAGGTWNDGYGCTQNSTAQNLTGEGLSAMSTLASWIPLIALVIAAAIVIGVIVTYLGRSGE